MKKLLVLSVLIVLALPIFTSAATVEELQTMINALKAQLEQLQAQLAQQQTTTQVWCHDFNANLKIGMEGAQVKALQIALEKEGFLISSDEKNGEKFDESTASAVSGFQEKYRGEILTPLNLSHPTGFVGPSTRTKLNSLYGCKITPPPVCAQIITPAKNLTTGECKNFPTPCAVPANWQKVNECPVATHSATTTPPITLTNITPTSGPVGSAITLTGCGPESALGYNLIYAGPKNGSEKIDVVALNNGCGYMSFAVPTNFPTGTYTLSVKNNSTGETSVNSLKFTVTATPVAISMLPEIISKCESPLPSPLPEANIDYTYEEGKYRLGRYYTKNYTGTDFSEINRMAITGGTFDLKKDGSIYYALGIPRVFGKLKPNGEGGHNVYDINGNIKGAILLWQVQTGYLGKTMERGGFLKLAKYTPINEGPTTVTHYPEYGTFFGPFGTIMASEKSEIWDDYNINYKMKRNSGNEGGHIIYDLSGNIVAIVLLDFSRDNLLTYTVIKNFKLTNEYCLKYL